MCVCVGVWVCVCVGACVHARAGGNFSRAFTGVQQARAEVDVQQTVALCIVQLTLPASC